MDANTSGGMLRNASKSHAQTKGKALVVTWFLKGEERPRPSYISWKALFESTKMIKIHLLSLGVNIPR